MAKTFSVSVEQEAFKEIAHELNRLAAAEGAQRLFLIGLRQLLENSGTDLRPLHTGLVRTVQGVQDEAMREQLLEQFALLFNTEPAEVIDFPAGNADG